MDISHIPPEVLTLIFGQLVEYEDGEDDPQSSIHYGHLRNARLVCRRWSDIATTHLFQTLTLDSGLEDGDGTWFRRHTAWYHMINSETIQRVAQNVVICIHPDDDLEMDGGHDNDDDDNSSCHKFGTAVWNGILKLPNLNSLQIRFSKECLGAREYDWWEEMQDQVEFIPHRLQTLQTVFSAMQKRRAAFDKDNRTSTIRSLTLKNLQNVPIPEFTSSELYKEVIKDINELHLMIMHEYNEPGPDHDLDRIERQTYEPYLQKEFLPLAHQLRSLTLTFRECWGVIPGYFDGKGLVFPNLRTLTLGEFIIGHHDQFDWVLAQKSLETLRLDRCFIVSYLRVRDDQWDQWRGGVPTHDWHQYPEGSFGFHGDHVFGFSGTWETVYDRIRQGLPKLREFCSEHHEYYNAFDRRESMGAWLSPFRYIVFDSGLCPSPWIEAENWPRGDLMFGDNDPAVHPRDAPGSRSYYGARQRLNRCMETELGDSRAFEELLRTLPERG